MRIINDGLPEPLYRAVCDVREPDPDTISVTQLIGPPQIRQLTIDHWDDLEEMASDRIWLADGNAMHMLMERHGNFEGHKAEGFVEAFIDGQRVVGTFDSYYESGKVTDYKRVGIAALFNGPKPEWIAQVNCYAQLLRLAGKPVYEGEVCVIYRDWMKSKIMTKDYPQKAVEVFPVPLWSEPDAMTYLRSRLALHGQTPAPPCSPDERWQRQTQYAVKKGTNKRAVRVFDDEVQARAYVVLSNDPKLSIEQRPGRSVRCEDYCGVAKYCPQWAAEKATMP